MRARRVVLLALALLIGAASLVFAQRPGGMGPRPPGGPGPGGSMGGSSAPPVALSFQWIDVHVHLVGDRSDFRSAIAAAVAAMDDSGISTMVLISPPNVSGGRLWDVDDFLPVLTPPARFGFLGGGGTLNPIIHDTKPAAVDDAVRRRFEARAEDIIKKGAAGFGEITAHALIDFHFDVVAEDTKAPDWLSVPPNPPVLRANLAGFERLLAHNRGARIVWAHAGSDQLGWWTVGPQPAAADRASQPLYESPDGPWTGTAEQPLGVRRRGSVRVAGPLAGVLRPLRAGRRPVHRGALGAWRGAGHQLLTASADDAAAQSRLPRIPSVRPRAEGRCGQRDPALQAPVPPV